jgi:mRNA interferase MazF
MTASRGEVWLANLDPTRGSEQSGTRPVIIFQNDLINKYTTTVLAIRLTTNLRRATLPSCIQISQGDGGLTNDSVALCHQFRAIDKTRLRRKLGVIGEQTLDGIESCLLFTLGII